MASGMLLIKEQRRGLQLDPRTKLLLLITVSVFVLGGLGSDQVGFITPMFCALPILLYCMAGRVRTAFFYATVYALAYGISIFLLPQLTGVLQFVLLACTSILCRFLPGLILGNYVISTTTVSEFTAAMQKLHMSEKIIIPMSVMFRFFPTVREEFLSINAAMRMRGIGFGGGNGAKMVEYRLVPLLTCSAKIGEELSAAALTRGLGGDCKRTNICRIGFRLQDVLLMGLCLVSFGIAVLAYLVGY